MTNRDDPTELLRQELRSLELPEPDETCIQFRPAHDFFRADGEAQSLQAHNRRRRNRRLLVMASATTAAAAIVVFALVGIGSQKPDQMATPGSSAASPELTTVAQILDRAGAATVGDSARNAAFWRVDSVHQTGNAPEVRRTVWQGRDQPGVLIDGDSAQLIGPANFGLQTTALSWESLDALPTDSHAMLAYLQEEAAALDHPDWYVIKMAVGLLAETPAPADVRHALWAVIASVDGVTTTGRTSDAAGRSGWNVTYVAPGVGAQTYVVDTETGRLLESVVRLDRGSGEAFRITYLERSPSAVAPIIPEGCRLISCVPNLREFGIKTTLR